jgi:phosphate/sulfate permease
MFSHLQGLLLTWVCLAGGAGIVFGLSTYGYKIMKVFGVKSVKLTNSRGFCLELATAITVVVASRYGMFVFSWAIFFPGTKTSSWDLGIISLRSL